MRNVISITCHASAYLMRVSRYDQFMVSKANVKSPDTQQIWKDPATAQGGLSMMNHRMETA